MHPVNNPVLVPQQEPAERAQASWRNTLPIHPACDLIPPMSADEVRALGEDIIKNELKFPIAVIAKSEPREDGTIDAILIDGRSRLDAIELVTGHSVQVVWRPVFPGSRSRARAWFIIAGKWNISGMVAELDDDIDVCAYVLSVNIHRRHLTAEKKRESIANLIKATPEKSDRQIAETVKASPTTVGTLRAKLEAKGEVSKLDTRTDAKGVKQPARKKAKKPNTKPVASEEADADPEASAAARKAAYAAEEQQHLELDKSAPSAEPNSTARRHSHSLLVGRALTRIEELEDQLKHERAENIRVRSENRALTRDLEAKLIAISNEQFFAELERRLSLQFLRKHKATLKALRCELVTLDLKADPIADSPPVTKH